MIKFDTQNSQTRIDTTGFYTPPMQTESLLNLNGKQSPWLSSPDKKQCDNQRSDRLSKETLKMLYSGQTMKENENVVNMDSANGKITLWQFLLELLFSKDFQDIIRWTNNDGEFVLLKAEEVAKLWGLRKDKNHRMNYDKLSRALRYYYQKNIIRKVHGHKFVYQFSGWKTLIDMHKQQTQNPIAQNSFSPSNNDDCNPFENTHSQLKRRLSDEVLPQKNEKECKLESPSDEQESMTTTTQDTSLIEKCLDAFIERSLTEKISCVQDAYIIGFWSNLVESMSKNSHSLDRHAGEIDKKAESSLRPSSPNCQCSCHHDRHPKVSQENKSKHFPTFDSKVDSDVKATGVNGEQHVALHHKRHAINMQRLTEQIMLHSRNKSKCDQFNLNAKKMPVKVEESGFPKNPDPTFSYDGDEKKTESSESVKAEDGLNSQNCIWMPVPMRMLSQWMNMLNT